MNAKSLLSLLYLSSPALPIGAFAYSQGLESAIEMEWVKDGDDLAEWLSGVLSNGLAQQDLPLFYRMYSAWDKGDLESLNRWNQHFRASRESAELLLEDEQLGRSLKRLLISLDILDQVQLPENAGFFTLFAFAAKHFSIDTDEAALGLCWSWLENQVTVACKAIPLGQTAAQKVMLPMMEKIERAIAHAKLVSDSEIGATLPGFAIASAIHETQYSRLFRS
ncbi:urease accessory protein UreF [Alkalimarinus coralli]|uniref:urease accessory protein UreF n=1 Tax=Alkalimarinus coralli TaxID=2935863 RepID=UPI00202B0335|nr:urease accessory UreF family protein [Alkalimarinus coralli]